MLKLLAAVLYTVVVTALTNQQTVANQITPYFKEWLRRFDMAPDPTVTVSAKDSALVIVDMQNDFVGEFVYTPEQIEAGQSPCYTALGNSTGACFGVGEGDQVAGLLQSMLHTYSFATVLASMDDHSPEHCSFFAAASTASPPLACASNFVLAGCNASAFHQCQGTKYENKKKTPVYGPFPPHCVRGYAGSELYSKVHDALVSYQGEKHVGVKGLDLSTDSFGVFKYSEKSWDFYNKAGQFDPNDPRPAVLIRSMLTWEQHMTTSTGAASFTSPLHQYTQPPPFSTTGAAGSLNKLHADSLIESKGAAVSSILVTGLAGDWCVLDSALNAKATWPDKEVYFVVDALRPSFLPKAAAQMYLKKDPSNQLYDNGVWLHDPTDVASLLKRAGVHVIKSDQILK